MQTRAATYDDVGIVAELQRRWDQHWFGAEEHSLDEVREYFGYCGSLYDDSLLVFDGERLAGVGMSWGQDSLLLVDPDIEAAPVHDVLLHWFAGRGARVEVLAQDSELRARVEHGGWRYWKSSFDLLRTVAPDLELDLATWPAGIHVTGLAEADAKAVHRLIYLDAGWAEIPGHPERDFDSWHRLFVEPVDPADQVLAWRGERIVGIALTRRWDDGTGWVSQLATARDERRQGLGRALLLTALQRHVAAGATALGLTVQAANAGALALYLGVGLRVDREWRTYESAQPPGHDGAT